MTVEVDSQTVITVAVVVHDDDDIIESFVRETTEVMQASFAYYELLIVDNGSKAPTRAKIQNLQKSIGNIRMLCLSRWHDRDTALMAALDNAIGDYFVLLEIDGDPPALIPEFVRRSKSGYDVVIGRDTAATGHPRRYRFMSRVFHAIANRVLEFPIRATDSYYRAFSRTVVNSLIKIRGKRRYLKYYNSLVGFRQTHLRYEKKYLRQQGPRRSSSLAAMVRGIDLIISNSAAPLRVASLMGVVACGLNLMYLIYILVVTILKDQLAEGWLSMSIMNTTMFLMVFVILTLLSEYTFRVLEETRDRPLYFIDMETTSEQTSFQRTIEEQRLNVVQGANTEDEGL